MNVEMNEKEMLFAEQKACIQTPWPKAPAFIKKSPVNKLP